VRTNAAIITGIAGLSEFAQDLRHWHEREDAAKIASYASQAIEKFGTGGGNFRKMFAGFLDWASGVMPDKIPPGMVAMAYKSADLWSELARILEQASSEPESNEAWKQAGEKAGEIYDIESELFETL
jgi:glycine/D-amino acid oxidase-like deaminating enzyme